GVFIQKRTAASGLTDLMLRLDHCDAIMIVAAAGSGGAKRRRSHRLTLGPSPVFVRQLRDDISTLYIFSTRMSPSPVRSSIAVPPPFIFPRSEFSPLDPDTVIGKSRLTRPSPDWASMSTPMLSGSRKRRLPSPVRVIQPNCGV